jgi:hypothetical protein
VASNEEETMGHDQAEPSVATQVHGVGVPSQWKAIRSASTLLAHRAKFGTFAVSVSSVGAPGAESGIANSKALSAL